jgi:hypothetical protein
MKKSKFIVTKNSKELAAAVGMSPLDVIEWEVIPSPPLFFTRT